MTIHSVKMGKRYMPSSEHDLVLPAIVDDQKNIPYVTPFLPHLLLDMYRLGPR